MCNGMENVSTSLANNSSTIDPNDLKFGREAKHAVSHATKKIGTDCSEFV